MKNWSLVGIPHLANPHEWTKQLNRGLKAKDQRN